METRKSLALLVASLLLTGTNAWGQAESGTDGNTTQWLLICGILVVVVALIVFWAIVSSKKNKKPTPTPVVHRPATTNGSGSQDGSPGIVVRRKTATILKKQSLEDVMDNPHYMKIDLEDCCYESAVRRMYIKDTCVEELYAMYERDQQNPEAAKEYGCMVLGRWVHDAENSEYYVSLEQVVLPGEDAVFDEYELNFGGKIKLRVLEQLRRLRRESNLQYDLTCWVHSHPGLTVFFSNADSTVQDQLKHPQHPKFLTAIVIDTLTPTMEAGIFTYHRDMTLNTKNDLKKLYSLKEWHQWASQSVEAAPVSPMPAAPVAEAPAAKAPIAEAPVAEASAQPQPSTSAADVETFNTLAKAKEHTTACFGINLTKDMVVDLCMALGSQPNGIAGTIFGRPDKQDQLTSYIAERLSESDTDADLQAIGSFVVMSHFSVPTVRKTVSDRLSKQRFMMVYTPEDGLLTSIPIIGNDLCADENFYGTQRLEDLKLWTKKGR